ncbi:MAG: hypothetical protein M1548_05855 [Actinobacteria bacterium]|nr:hypothetical protein [Actinomycetota bacterium]
MIRLRAGARIKLLGIVVLMALMAGLVLIFQAASFASKTDGRIVWGQGTVTTPLNRLWDHGASTWNTPPAMNATNQPIQWAVNQAGPTRLENVVGVLTGAASNPLYVEVWNGSSWLTGTSRWTANTRISTRRSFDIAYEETGGRAMVVYSSATANNMSYRIWDGATWTAAADVLTTAEGGTIEWVELVAKPNSNEITLVYSWNDGTTGQSLRAITWNGTGWDNTTAGLSAVLETNLAYTTAAGDTKPFDAAYESSGELMIVWGYEAPAATPYARYVTRASGASWSGITALGMATWADEATFVSLAAEPGGDRMIVVSASSTSDDLQYGTWSGTAWTNTANVDTAIYAANGAGMMPLAAGWITGGASPLGIVIYADNAVGPISYRTWNGAWSALQTFTTSPAIGYSNNIDIDRQPGENKIMVTIGDSNGDLWAKTYDGTTWANTEGGAALELNLSGGALYMPFDFVYDRYARTTAGDGTAIANQTVGKSATDVVIDSFTLSTNTGIDTVTGLTFTGTANFTSTNVTNVRLYLDSNADGVPDTPASPIATGSLAGTVATFSGLNINVTKTSTQYLIVFDVAATATSVVIASPSTISAGTATNTFVDQDTNSAAITIDATPPGTATGFVAGDGENGQSTLNWTNPGDADFAGIRIMRRSDGTYPTGPTDPLATQVWEDFTAPIATTYTDTTALNGTTYNYAVFTRDTNGNWNTTVTAGVTADTGRPGPTVTVTSPTLAGGNVYTGETNVEIQRLAMSTNFVTATLNSITVNRTGTTDADIATGGVKIYTDGGTLGVIDGTDSQIGSGTFSAGSVNISVTAQTIGTTASNFLVVYDIAASATPGNTTGSSIANSSSIGVTGAYQVTLSPGAPLNSSSFTITAPTITFSGNVQLGGATVYQGQTNKAMMKFSAQTNAGGVTWNTIKLDEYGNGTATTNVSAVKLYRDNGDTNFDPATDTNIPITPSTFSAESTIFTITGGESLSTTAKIFFVVYDIAGGATTGVTVGSQMVDNTYIGVSAGTVTGVSNFNSGTPTINANTVTVTNAAVASGNVAKGATNVVMQKLGFSTNYGTASLTAIRVDKLGNLADNQVSAVKIYTDLNGDGAINGSDAQIGSSGTFSASSVNITFPAQTISTPTASSFLVVYDIAGSAPAGNTIGSRIASQASITVSAPDTVAAFPNYDSNTLTVSESQQVTVTSQTVARGSVTATATAGQDYVVMQAITLKTNSGNASWTGFTLTEYGSGTATTNVANVYLVKETNSKAGYQSPQEPVASLDTTITITPATYSAESQAFTLTTAETINTTGATYYIIYNIKNTATVGTTVGSRLADQTAITVGAPYTVVSFTNLQSNLLTVVSTPHTGFANSTNLCETCHSTHLAPDFSNDTTLPAAGVNSTRRILNKAYLESPSVVNNYDHKTFNLLCEACHDGTGAVKNIKADYEPDSDPAKNTEGHQLWRESTQTIGYKPPPAPLPANKYNIGAKIPCMVCHDAHGSTKGNSKMLADGLHTYATSKGWSDGGDGKITAGTDEICLVCHKRSGDAARESTVLGIDLIISNATQNHSSITGCTGCHGKVHNPVGGESGGGTQCGGCHSTIYGAMDAGSNTGYHHYMSSANAPTYGSYPTTNVRTCAICHVDHDVFRPDLNNPGGVRAKNLRTDIAVQPDKTADTGFTSLDFDNTLTNGGICISCHSAAQTKDTTNRKNDGSAQTPAIAQVAYNTSMHNYTTGVSSTYTKDSSTFTGNCVKCHNDTTTKQYQSSTLKFAVHDSTYRHILTNNGTATGGTGVNVASTTEATYNSLEENFCYICHSGGTVAGTDIYGNAMTANAENVKNQFTDAGQTYKHPIADATQAGRHKADEYTAATAGSWNQNTNNTRHVECADCHSPHAAQNGVSASPGATIGTVLVGAWGIYPGATFKTTGFAPTDWPAAWTAPATWSKGTLVSTNEEWQLCLKCHSNFAYGATPPSAAQTPSGQAETDQSKEFNPNNLGGHAVAGDKTAALGNLTDGGTFVAPWTTSSRMTCSDCHTNNVGTARGPHGSANKWILKAAYNPAGTTAADFQLCWGCHDQVTYTTGGAGGGTAFSDGGATPRNLHSNSIHQLGSNQTGHIMNCGTCHGQVPHGSDKRHIIHYYTDPQPYYNGLLGSSARPQVGAYTHAAAGSYAEGSCSIYKRADFSTGCYSGHAAGP